MSLRSKTIYKCPYCSTLYSRGSINSVRPWQKVWSDGVEAGGANGPSGDPVVLCVCQKFFATRRAYMEHDWGFFLPDDVKCFHAENISLSDTVKLLQDEDMLFALGERLPLSQKLQALLETPIVEEKQSREEALDSGRYVLRYMIWRKLSDKIRDEGIKKLSKAEHVLLRENAKALVALFLDDIIDPEVLLWKAELHRNIGEFGKSIKTLRLISNPSKKEREMKRKMIFLNLVRNRNLVPLSEAPLYWWGKLGLWLKLVW